MVSPSLTCPNPCRQISCQSSRRDLWRSLRIEKHLKLRAFTLITRIGAGPTNRIRDWDVHSLKVVIDLLSVWGECAPQKSFELCKHSHGYSCDDGASCVLAMGSSFYQITKLRDARGIINVGYAKFTPYCNPTPKNRKMTETVLRNVLAIRQGN